MGQNNNLDSINFSKMFDTLDFVKYFAKVQIVDSQYFLIVNVSVTNEKEIRFKGKRYYQDLPCCESSPERIYFQKIIRGISVQILSSGFRDVFDEYDVGEDLIDKLHPLNDTICLDNFIPLEIASYKIGLEIQYYFNASKYWIRISDTPFDVKFIPPKSMF